MVSRCSRNHVYLEKEAMWSKLLEDAAVATNGTSFERVSVYSVEIWHRSCCADFRVPTLQNAFCSTTSKEKEAVK